MLYGNCEENRLAGQLRKSLVNHVLAPHRRSLVLVLAVDGFKVWFPHFCNGRIEQIRPLILRSYCGFLGAFETERMCLWGVVHFEVTL